MAEAFTVIVSFQGKSSSLSNIPTSITGRELLDKLGMSDEDSEIKILYKGKRVDPSNNLFAVPPPKTPKILIMATATNQISEIQSKRSDPTIRGFENERSLKIKSPDHWGELTGQDPKFKFCRLQACTWQSFGHRPTDTTPHAFRAMKLLEKLSTDPGIVAIMKERQLVVGTLGEMDPIDDRFMNKKQNDHPGTCILGYNTNGGLRIDLKLRTDDLKDFRPYPQLVATLIHELSHNWVGEHDFLFFTNYGQMRAEYFHTHLRLRTNIQKGKTTAAMAGIPTHVFHQDVTVYDIVMSELKREMAQYGLQADMISEGIRKRCQELDETHTGQRLGGRSDSTNSKRDATSEAAERRAKG
jgi:hypothetical protein